MLPESVRRRALAGFIALLAVTILATPWRFNSELSDVAKVVNRSYGAADFPVQSHVVHRPIFLEPSPESLQGEAGKVTDIHVDASRLAFYWLAIALLTIAACALIPLPEK